MGELKPGNLGINADKWLRHRSLYSESQINLQEATSENQAKLKAAKADGIHIDALKMVSKLNRKDPAEAATFLRAVLEGALVEKCAFMFQGDMLNGGSIADLFKTPEPSARAVAQFTENQALEIGYSEGLNGGLIDNLQKQFAAGTAELNAAIRGFKRGRQFMEASAKPGIVAVAPSKGRRGGRRKADAGVALSETAEASAPSVSGFDGDAEFDGGSDGDDEVAGKAIGGAPINMEAIAQLSNHKMAKVWNELTGQNIRKFENRDTALAKFEKLRQAQQNNGTHQAH